jgi:hypothetical protein
MGVDTPRPDKPHGDFMRPTSCRGAPKRIMEMAITAYKIMIAIFHIGGVLLLFLVDWRIAVGVMLIELAQNMRDELDKRFVVV